jgi:beta-lactamase class C
MWILPHRGGWNVALKRTTKCVVLSLTILFVPALSAQVAAPVPAAKPLAIARVPGDNPIVLRQLAQEFETAGTRLMQTGQVVGMAGAIVKNGKVVSVRGFGTTDVMTGDAVTTDTSFRLASLSKAFASTTTALLVRDGYLGWDLPVQDYVPMLELSDSHQAPRLTIRDLLSHRVGLPHNALDRDLEKDEPYPMLVYKLRELPMTCSVGDCYAYQNVAFSLIGDVTFASTGRFFSYEVERRIFHPLAMEHATYGRTALESSPHWARPHVRQGRRWVALRPKENYYRVTPAAGVNASIADMAIWANAQLGHYPDVLPQDLLTELQTAQVATPGEAGGSPWRRARLAGAEYALGWRVYDYAGHRVVFHAGAVQGYRGMIALVPDHDFGVVLLWNCESGAPAGLMPTVLDRFLGMPAFDWLQIAKLMPQPRAKPARRAGGARATTRATH